MRRPGFLLLCCALLPAIAGAEEVKLGEVKLEDVVARTLAGSPALAQGEARVKQASGQLKQAKSAFDWVAAGKTGWERLYLPRVRNGVLTDELETTSALKAEAGVSKTFGNGITIQPGVSFYANTAASEAQTFGLTRPRPHFNVNIPLWSGSGSNNPARAKQEAAERMLEGTRFESDFLKARALHDAVQVYWRCLALGQQLQAARRAEADSLDYDALLKRQTETGQLEPAELDRVMAQGAMRHVEVAKLKLTGGACLRELAQSMGQNTDTADSVPVAGGMFPDIAALDREIARLDAPQMIAVARARRLDLKALSFYAGAAAEKVKGAENGLGPKVDLSIDTDGVFVNLSKSLEGNLENGLLEEAQGAESQARIALRLAEDQMQRDISDQVQALKGALADWKALDRAARLMDGVVESVEKRVRAGVLARDAQVEAGDSRAQTRQQAIDAQWRFFSALAALRLYTGTIASGTDGAAAGLAVLFRTVPGAADEHG